MRGMPRKPSLLVKRSSTIEEEGSNVDTSPGKPSEFVEFLSASLGLRQGSNLRVGRSQTLEQPCRPASNRGGGR